MTAVALPKDSAVVRPVLGSRRTRRVLLALIGLAVVVAGARWIGHWWTIGRFIEKTDDAYVGGDVTVIAPKVAGFITQVGVRDNQQVRAGDLLIKLDDREFRAALARATAAVEGQRARLEHLEALRRLQLAMIAQARPALAAAEAEMVRTRDDEARYHQLKATEATSLQSVQQAEADYKKGVAGRQGAQAALLSAERQLDVIDAQRRQAEAALAEALAEKETAELNLGFTELRAPVDGMVGNRSARVGAFAVVGAQLIALVPAQGLWVDANFKESQLATIRPGLPVAIRADVAPGRVFRGHVVSLSPATGAQFSVLPPENATGNFTKIIQRVPVRIELEAEGSILGVLRPGLSVTASVGPESVP
ncbi:MAG TPA: HlyD family secretion protein [Myxococcaceae bacterium]|nr:HlyD family secretion protein [Myxococcaceae bacterium]